MVNTLVNRRMWKPLSISKRGLVGDCVSKDIQVSTGRIHEDTDFLFETIRNQVG